MVDDCSQVLLGFSLPRTNLNLIRSMFSFFKSRWVDPTKLLLYFISPIFCNNCVNHQTVRLHHLVLPSEIISDDITQVNAI